MATDLQIAARKVVSINPATGEVLRELDCATEPKFKPPLRGPERRSRHGLHWACESASRSCVSSSDCFRKKI